jgi:outer membrane lipoprotein SlyB
MEPSYNEWRKASYDEVMELRNLKRRSRNEMLAGVVGIVGGIAGIAMGDSAAARTAGAVAAGSGSYLIKRGLETRDQMGSSIEILQELGESLQYEVEERVIELDDRTVRLSGSVEEQYDRWRSVLQEMYKLEYGDGDSSSEPDVALN